MKKFITPLFLFVCTVFFIPVFLSAQWTKTNGIPGGEIGRFMKFGDKILVNAGQESYFSSNQGQTWAPMPAASNGVSFWDIKTDGQTLIGQRYEAGVGRIVRSYDFGESWKTIPSADTMLFYETFVYDGYIYGTDYKGLYRTNDDGASWEYLSHEQYTNIQVEGNLLTAVRYPYIVQSTDGGFTWNSLLHFGGNVIDLLHHENHLFAFMQSNGCYASDDNGQTWKHYTGMSFDQAYQFFWHQGEIYSVANSKTKRSPDLGKNWLPVSFGVSYDFRPFSGISTGNAILMGSIYGVFSKLLRSTDNSDSWFAADFGILSGSSRLHVHNDQVFAPGVSDVYRLDADGLNWSALHLSPATSSFNNYYGFNDFVQSGGNWVVTYFDRPYVSLDNGVTWFESFVGGNNLSDYIGRLEVVGDKILAFSDAPDFYSVFISENNGLTFQLLTLNNQNQTYGYAWNIDQGVVYCLTYNRSIYRSDGQVENWTQISADIPLDSIGNLGKLIVSGDLLYIFDDFYRKKMVFSRDGGQHWEFTHMTDASGTFGDYPLNQLMRLGNQLLACSNRGVFISSDEGLTWSKWNQGMEGYRVTGMAIHDGFLWATADGGGIWKRSLADLNLSPVAGKVYYDKNANGLQDAGEPAAANVIVQSLSTQAYTNTRPDGTFSLLSNLGQEQIRVQPPLSYYTAQPAVQSVTVPASGLEFGLSIPPGALDLSLDFHHSTAMRPGFSGFYQLHWSNEVPAPAQQLVATLDFPFQELELIETTPAFSSQNGNRLQWDLGDAAPLAAGNITVRYRVPVTDTLGTVVCATAAISANGNDLQPGNNSRSHCTTVVGSYDPNDKQAFPSDKITVAQLADKQPIEYTVRFQNTGNFPATFVRIIDTLQSFFQPATFHLLSSSHPCTWTMRGQGVVEFFFNDIQLPPSSFDEPASHGFVRYSVQADEDLSPDLRLRNTAHIFFDYNQPVTTNTTETIVGLVKTSEPGVTGGELRCFPNPASKNVLLEKGNQSGELLLQDAAGRVLMRRFLSEEESTFSVEDLPQGVYQVIFRNEKSVQYCQLAVLH